MPRDKRPFPPTAAKRQKTPLASGSVGTPRTRPGGGTFLSHTLKRMSPQPVHSVPGDIPTNCLNSPAWLAVCRAALLFTLATCGRAFWTKLHRCCLFVTRKPWSSSPLLFLCVSFSSSHFFANRLYTCPVEFSSFFLSCRLVRTLYQRCPILGLASFKTSL